MTAAAHNSLACLCASVWCPSILISGRQGHRGWAGNLTQLQLVAVTTCQHYCCRSCRCCCLQHGHYTAKADGMQAVRQFVPPNTLRWATLTGTPAHSLCDVSCICKHIVRRASEAVGWPSCRHLWERALSLRVHPNTRVSPRGSLRIHCTRPRVLALTPVLRARVLPLPPLAATGWCTTAALCAASPPWAPPCGPA